MTVSRKLSVNRLSQIEIVNDSSRTKVKGFGNDFFENIIRKYACAEGVNHNRYGVSNTDCISKLNLTLFSKLSRYNVLCNISCRISCRTVNLCRVLTREAAAAVSAYAAVCINDYLSACKTAVACGAACNKSACGVYIDNCIVVEKLLRNDGLDNIFKNITSDSFKFNVGAVL